MFKVKMSLLLKSAKFKVAIIALVLAAILAGIVFIPANKAVNMSGQVKVKAIKSGSTANGKDYYIIRKTDNSSGYDSLFCVEENAYLSSKSETTYSNPIAISNASGYFNFYNSGIWLINNMYTVSTKGNGIEDAVAKNVLALNLANLLTTDYAKSKVAETGLNTSGITPEKIYDLRNKVINTSTNENALEFAEQVALWRYAKNVGTSFSDAYGANPNQLLSGTSLTNDEQLTLKYTYYALRAIADVKNTSSSTSLSNCVVLKKDNAQFNANNYQIGPYYIESNGYRFTSYSFGDPAKGQYPVSATITRGDGSQVNAGAEVFVKNSDGSFYINLANYKDAQKVDFRIDYVVSGINTEAYVLDGGENQNLLAVNKSVSATSLMDSKTISIPGTYNVVVKKVKNDGTTVITSSEATFKVNGKDQNTSKGILSIAQNKKISNTNQTDTYEISETKAPNGFIAANGTAKLTVKFKQDGSKYIIDKDKTTLSGINGAKVNVSADNATITVTIPNQEITGKYNVVLKKVKNDGTTVITSSEATFKINGKEQNTSKGILNIVQGKAISGTSQVDTYEITETKAPNGFIAANGTAKLTVPFKANGNQYVINKDKITLTGIDNAKFEVSQDNATITVYIPNKEQTVKYNVELYKVDENGYTIKTPANFSINGKLATTENGKIVVASNVEVKDVNTVGTYTIKETKAPDNYNLFKGIIKLTVKMTKVNDVLTLNKDGITLDAGSDSKVRFTLDGTTIKVYVPNTAKVFDLSLRKYISAINGKKVEPSREPVINEASIKMLEETGTASYYHTKNSIGVKVGDEVEYTIRVYNEGEILGYAKQITDYLPDGLTFVKLASDNSKEYTTQTKAGSRVIVIDYSGNTTIKKLRDFIGKQNFNVTSDYYQQVKIICKVEDTNKTYITNRGEITNYGYNGKDENGNAVWVDAKEIGNADRDSVQNTIKGNLDLDNWYENAKENTYTDETGKTVVDKNYYPGAQDDDDFETVVINREFDLSLRKFITDVNGKELEESREPQVDISKLASGEAKTATYNHSKTPLDVNTSDIVTYTIRVYNEGEMDGYAAKIMDDIPEGLEFVPAEYDQDGKAKNTNAQYGWVLYREMNSDEKAIPENMITYNGKSYVVTDKVNEADVIVTDYLSKENGTSNLLKAFNAKTMKQLDYKDVKVAFKVIEPTTSDRIITNYAQITDDTDSEGNPVDDRDSTPNKWNEGEDDQDIEKIKVRYFDLALRKWVTKAIVYENGFETVTETGHQPYDDPEQVVKVDLKNTNLNNVEVKFEYSIRVINEGQVEGYAKEISDYIPAGLKFVAADNPQWKEVDGKIVTRALENTLLKPGEYADVTVLLTWVNGEDNLGLKTNIAEISEDYNKYGTPDIDSTPNNQVPGEDDIDDAPVILAIRTGEPIIYTGVAVVALAIVSVGAFVVKRRILK